MANLNDLVHVGYLTGHGVEPLGYIPPAPTPPEVIPPRPAKLLKHQIAELLDTNPLAVERAIVRIYERQTEDEQASEETRHRNGVGFSGSTASRGTYYAKWILSGKHLTGQHLVHARRIAHTHINQLVAAAKLKQQRAA